MKLFIFTLTLLIALTSFAQNDDKFPISNESEAGIVSINGNTRSESFLFKQSNEYTRNKSKIKLNGNYIRNSSRDNATNITTSNEKWDAGLRYEYEIEKDKFSAFAGQNVESDKQSGIDRRYNSDLGGKYVIVKNETYNNFVELGYRFSKAEYVNDPTSDDTIHYARLYKEIEKKWNPTFSNKLWAEYLPNIEDFDDFLLNAELSFVASLTNIFSLKTGYLVKYDNEPPLGVAHKTDTTFSTSLIAKF